ncbi:MAG: helix-hairpin-helix domain-containing protein [Firmicutes bacterium]|nr:helix-hairpin-helix domain-containing protein [Bacillota bacterium]
MRRGIVRSKRVCRRVEVRVWLGLALLVLTGWADVAAPIQQKPPPSDEPLDLNTATVEQLQKLPGIGPKTAEAIVRFREKSGPFRRVEDLLAVRGITRKKLAVIAPRVTVKPVGETSPPPRRTSVRN